MTVTAQLDLAFLDAADIVAIGRFYAALTGWEVVREDADRFGIRTPDRRPSGGPVGPAAYGGPRAGPTSGSVAAPAPELNARPADAS